MLCTKIVFALQLKLARGKVAFLCSSNSLMELSLCSTNSLAESFACLAALISRDIIRFAAQIHLQNLLLGSSYSLAEAFVFAAQILTEPFASMLKFTRAIVHLAAQICSWNLSLCSSNWLVIFYALQPKYALEIFRFAARISSRNLSFQRSN